MQKKELCESDSGAGNVAGLNVYIVTITVLKLASVSRVQCVEDTNSGCVSSTIYNVGDNIFKLG